jgi:DNA-binding IclR family transcriptional regulator
LKILVSTGCYISASTIDRRKKDYAIDLEEVMEGVHCVSAPIRDHTNKVIAPVSISSPAFRLTKEKLAETKGPLIETCLDISKKWVIWHLSK